MSLNFDTSAIPLSVRTVISECDGNIAMGEYFKKGDRVMSPRTNMLIWATMAVDIGQLTSENVDEFFFRIKLYEKLFGAMMRNEDGDLPVNRDDIVAHIGLSTNVSFVKRAKWLKRITDCFEREEIQREMYRQEREARLDAEDEADLALADARRLEAEDEVDDAIADARELGAESEAEKVQAFEEARRDLAEDDADDHVCSSCGVEEGESHKQNCEARGFEVGKQLANDRTVEREVAGWDSPELRK